MSKIEVDAIDKQSGSTLTLGGSGTAVTLGAGATQSGFGRTGTVDWQTSIKTGDFTATSGEGYFVNTTSGAITVTLPASPSVGDIVAIKDYAQTFDTNNCTVGRNSQPIEGQTFDLILDTEGVAITLIYGDATKGWQSVNSNEVTNVAKFVTATGGTITTSGNFKIHTFTGPGTFCVSCKGNPAGSNTVDYLVLAGGASGNMDGPNPNGGGGGGAGGYRESSGAASGCYTASPLGACVAALPVTATGFPITVGGGGPATSSIHPNDSPGPGSGSNSIFSTITSAGGGTGGYYNGAPGAAGGSGGGGGANAGNGAAGNTPPVSPPQGNSGSNASSGNPGSGGGAGSAGSGGTGGSGTTSSITASPVTRGGGGGRGTPGSSGGPGGGGARQTSGTANTGGGGGGSSGGGTTGGGGSGIVIIRYKFQ